MEKVSSQQCSVAATVPLGLEILPSLKTRAELLPLNGQKSQSPYRCSLENGGDCTSRLGRAESLRSRSFGRQIQEHNGTVVATD